MSTGCRSRDFNVPDGKREERRRRRTDFDSEVATTKGMTSLEITVRLVAGAPGR
jgi:hypothetical protein